METYKPSKWPCKTHGLLVALKPPHQHTKSGHDFHLIPVYILTNHMDGESTVFMRFTEFTYQKSTGKTNPPHFPLHPEWTVCRVVL